MLRPLALIFDSHTSSSFNLLWRLAFVETLERLRTAASGGRFNLLWRLAFVETRGLLPGLPVALHVSISFGD